MAQELGPVTKGSLGRIEGGGIVDVFNFQYNPTEHSEEFSVNWAFTSAVGQFLPVASFKNFGKPTVNMEFFLYSHETEDPLSSAHGANMKRMKAKLRLFTVPGSKFSVDTPQFVSPGTAILVLGDDSDFVVVDRLNFKNTMYNRRYEVTMCRASLRMSRVSAGIESEAAVVDTLRRDAGYYG